MKSWKYRKQHTNNSTSNNYSPQNMNQINEINEIQLNQIKSNQTHFERQSENYKFQFWNKSYYLICN